MASIIGILSDTHLGSTSEIFRAQVASCFAKAGIILHAGDLTSLGVLDAFAGKRLFAVHGNMCDRAATSTLPACRTLELGGFTIVLTHGHRLGYGDLEERLLMSFPEADCIVYGHTHRPVCHRVGTVLMVNPGSFSATGRYGAAGTYALLSLGDELSGEIRQVGALP
jgi:putative phosphoesterase